MYGHLSVRQLVETQRRVDRLWHTAGLFDDMIHRISEEEELTPQVRSRYTCQGMVFASTVQKKALFVLSLPLTVH